MAKDTKDTKKTKQIKIGKLVIVENPMELIIVAVLLLITFLSPNIYLITTARYGQGSETDNHNVEIALGQENTEENFLLYFQWFNVLHELGHGVLKYNSNIKLSNAEEEQLVNDFALAYWLYYGEEDKINKLTEIVDYAATHIESDAENGITYMEFAEKNWYNPSFETFNNYGWFQFNSVKESINKRKSLDEVLKKMGIENITIPEQKLLQYPTINEDVSTQIINDAVDNFHSWGLEFPKVYQSFNNDPNANYSKGVKNILGIYTLIHKFSK